MLIGGSSNQCQILFGCLALIQEKVLGKPLRKTKITFSTLKECNDQLRLCAGTTAISLLPLPNQLLFPKKNSNILVEKIKSWGRKPPQEQFRIKIILVEGQTQLFSTISPYFSQGILKIPGMSQVKKLDQIFFLAIQFILIYLCLFLSISNPFFQRTPQQQEAQFPTKIL